MLKKEARKEYANKRNGISFTDKNKWDDLILIQFQTLDIPFIDYLLTFYPMEDRNEVNTFLVTDYLHFRNPALQICYPKTNLADCSMQAILCQADSIFEANAFNVLEPTDNEVVSPQQLDLIIVPFLICDKSATPDS